MTGANPLTHRHGAHAPCFFADHEQPADTGPFLISSLRATDMSEVGGLPMALEMSATAAGPSPPMFARVISRSRWAGVARSRRDACAAVTPEQC